MIVTLGMSILFIASIAYLTYRPAEHDQTAPEMVVMEVLGDSTTLYRNGAPIYYKIKDSVYFNFIDSSQITWDQVEIRNTPIK